MHPRHTVGQASTGATGAGGATDASTGVMDFLGSIPGPVQTGQQLGTAAHDAASSLSQTAQDAWNALSSSASMYGSATDAAQQAYQDQARAAADLLKQQQMQASGSARGAASNLGTIVLIAAAGIILALVLTRK